MDKGLHNSNMEFASGRRRLSMMEITCHKGARFGKFTTLQDMIGWQQFMEGMISKEIVDIQQRYVDFGGGTMTVEERTKGLVI